VSVRRRHPSEEPDRSQCGAAALLCRGLFLGSSGADCEGHTFGADGVRVGISLPALPRLMGHSPIHTTMLYVQLAPQDVWREYARAVQNRTHLHATKDL
jgi:hypothetical protein